MFASDVNCICAHEDDGPCLISRRDRASFVTSGKGVEKNGAADLAEEGAETEQSI